MELRVRICLGEVRRRRRRGEGKSWLGLGEVGAVVAAGGISARASVVSSGHERVWERHGRHLLADRGGIECGSGVGILLIMGRVWGIEWAGVSMMV